ncbi:hypothetical protein BRYFOR_05040 [Marvinbryantia formatexigens DSM 14469]|uniref:Uncharacterized protein n=1 Tax=Marvinbryantia formatexigens DSM 14469 TaxID=478749 RepID=C6L8V1_9FIRM|nr:hypothetical protein BRYFOR_05040 [Marvinbryantia formatexigens DSM 14469]
MRCFSVARHLRGAPVAGPVGCQASESLKLTIKDRNGDIRERKTLRRK